MGSSRRARFEQLEPRILLSSLPYGAGPDDTGEFMLGDVVATVVLFESNGSIDDNQEDWNPLERDADGQVILDSEGRTINAAEGPNLIEETKDRIVEGLAWWEDTLANFYELNYDNVDPVHSLNFIHDFQYAHNPIETGYEPINRKSSEYELWVKDFLEETGHLDAWQVQTDIRSFNHAQRVKHDADWAYTIFVANDYNDPAKQFAPGGDFLQAFAFSGGLHVVSPASRPPSTFAHETGHIFYARDEYDGSGASYTDRRGYYNSQNLNAYDNPADGFEQQDSIMDTGAELEGAWTDNTSSDSSLAMMGWQDSDNDGVFDVLDVPLTLTGTGYYNPHQEGYHFQGQSKVQTLVNVNSGPRSRANDITINEVDRLVYSLDDGATWNVARNYNAHEVDIEVTLPVQPGEEILIRSEAVDPVTGQVVASSNEVFRGTAGLPTAVPQPGIHGFVWDDRDHDGQWDQEERGVPEWEVQLVDEQGAPLETAQYLEADDYADTSVLDHVLTNATLSALLGTDEASVGVTEMPGGSGRRVFGSEPRFGDDWATEWTSQSRVLRIDLESPTTFVKIDAIAPDDGSVGRLEIYDVDGNLLGRTTTSSLREHEVATLSIGMPTPEISYALVRSTGESKIMLDNLQVGPSATAVSGDFGAYALPYLPPGDYRVAAVPPGEWRASESVGEILDVTVEPHGTMAWPDGTGRPSDFAGVPAADASMWNNLVFHHDVNDDWVISPVDALLVIDDLNSNSSRKLLPETDAEITSFIDVSGDGYVSPLDALLVIQALNAGEPESGGLSEADLVQAWSATWVPDGGTEGEVPSEPVAGIETTPLSLSLDPGATRSERSAASEQAAGEDPVASPIPQPVFARPGRLPSRSSPHASSASVFSSPFDRVEMSNPQWTDELLDRDGSWLSRAMMRERTMEQDAVDHFRSRVLDRSAPPALGPGGHSEVLTSTQFDELLTVLAADTSAAWGISELLSGPKGRS
ncbi:MAG: dockerin type I domain-containing protein [Planctomycetota bacterium]